MFWDAINHKPVDIKDMDANRKKTSSIREYVEKFMHRINKLILAAAKSTNEGYLKTVRELQDHANVASAEPQGASPISATSSTTTPR